MINTRVSIVLLTVGPRRSGCCLFDPFAPPHLTNDSGAPVTSDTDGNLLSARVNGTLLGAVTWDARNRLLTAGNVTYTYDAENRRINSTKSAQTTSYIWSRGGLDRLLVKTNPDGSITRYIHRLGLIYEETSPSGGGTAAPSFYHYNWQGSTVALSNAAGNVTARISYSPYGERTIESGTVTTPFLFNAQFGVMTEPNGLLTMQARFYSPIFRRFLSEDPAGFTGGINLLAYASGDPVNLIDPFGLGPSPVLAFIDGLLSIFDSGLNGIYYKGSDAVYGLISMAVVRRDANGHPIVNGAVSGYINYLFGSGHNAVLGQDLIRALQNQQALNPLPLSQTMENEYFPLDLTSLDNLVVNTSLQNFRYMNDGKVTQVNDVYAFPRENDNHQGGTDNRNWLLSVTLGLFGKPYNVAGSYEPPSSP